MGGGKYGTRIEYIDALRGFAMLMVIFCHCTLFALEMEENAGCVVSIFSVVMLPLFFYISGLFALPHLRFSQIKNRGLYILLPTLIMYLLYQRVHFGIYSHAIEYLGEEYKCGYWFTLVLVTINLMHFIVSKIVRKEVLVLPALILLCIALLILKQWDWSHNGAFLCRWFSLRLLAEHLPYYIIGMACKRYWEWFHRIIRNERVMALIFITFILLFNLDRGGMYKAMVIGILGSILAYRICFANQQLLSSATFIGRQLTIIGRYTLPIYLVHYFFFLGINMSEIGTWLASTTHHWLLTTLTCVILTIVITYSSILVAKLMESISPEIKPYVIGK